MSLPRVDLSGLGGSQTLALLGDAGFQAFIVGGPVRNALLGVPVSDIDIATNARPEQVLALAERAGLKAVPTGIEHGTITLVEEGRGVEVTTFRRDVATDGRRAVVTFSDTIAEDAARRDFTMNALYADASGQVIDPLGGLPDLLARRVRFIGHADQRIAEDYLRILRFFRFTAWYGDPELGLDADSLAACAAGADGLAQLSVERVTAELLKLCSAPDPAPSLASMAQTGILARVLPGARAEAVAPLVHLEHDSGVGPDGLRRLAALGGTPQTTLRLSKPQTKALHVIQQGIADMTGLATRAYHHGAPLAWDIALLRAAVFEGPVPSDAEHQIAKGAGAQFPLRAADLPMFQGPALGAALKQAERAWIESDFTTPKHVLISQLAGKP